MKLFTLCLVLIFLASCCHKEYCIVGFSEGTRIELHGFNNEGSGPFKAYLVAKDNYKVIDSASVSGNSLLLNAYTFGDSVELKDHNIIIQTPTTSDTIYNITYDLVEKRGCNDCFLKKDKEIHTLVENFSVDYNGITYTTSDTVVINP